MDRIRRQLIRASGAWASGRGYNAAETQELRKQAVLLNHAHYLRNIPVYQQIAREEGAGEAVDIETIKRKLMLPDDIFKSYSQEWLDNRDFARMDRWLSGIYHRRIETGQRNVNSIDEWLEQLGEAGIHVTYSSGTSGAFSFVPRDAEERDLARTANICYLSPLLKKFILGENSDRSPLKRAFAHLPPEALTGVIGKTGIPGFDAFFLGFRKGRMGNQMLIQELAPVFKRRYFLYESDLDATALRCLRRGARTADEQRQVEEFQDRVIKQRSLNYLRLLEHIRSSTAEKRKVFIFGAPAQFRELGEVISGRVPKPVLNEGSLILFGGGWKSFTGEAMQRDDLVKMLSDCFSLPAENILEGYSMTEISLLMLRCRSGRFHIPPFIEPVILDEELNPVEQPVPGPRPVPGNPESPKASPVVTGDAIPWSLPGRKEADTSQPARLCQAAPGPVSDRIQGKVGIFGFLDPLASSYPGFIISGDFVHLEDGECPCGLSGPAVTEIGRVKSREVKGCGGIMGSISEICDAKNL